MPSMAFGARSTAEQVSAGVDLTGMVAIVTGGSSGLGVETVRVLALRGAKVILACRNTSAGEKVKGEILKAIPNAKIEVQKLDLSSMDSVTRFSEAFKASKSPLHILINNAGIMSTPFQLTGHGTEAQMQTNHFSHFLLTENLLPVLKETAKQTGQETRIVLLSSLLHQKTYPEGIRFDKLNEKEGYVPFLAYGQSKLANILHARELSRRLQEEGANVNVNAVHPGLIKTKITRSFFPKWIEPVMLFFVFLPFRLMGLVKTIPQGAATSVYVATHPNVAGVSGTYFADCAVDEGSAMSRDMSMATRLWEVSEKTVAPFRSR